MSNKIKVGTALEFLTYDENIFVDTLISMDKSEESIVDQVKALRFGKRIENLKFLMRNAGYDETRTNELIEQNMAELLSTRRMEDILKAIRSANPIQGGNEM
ncbi:MULTISPECIES: hypothetical protein [Pandoraea]|uniref:hypothetical protein n=1 Tax=Pandoraea TaxID=93217 RepID=UPI001F5CD010|nr:MULTISPECIES: hypothetical protein [Pandoraea]MCI3206393.1 hypothetical protein [Pandoraea sp. LA3]MDN4584421.1 hypothetical protein [Pandoraea capi]